MQNAPASSREAILVADDDATSRIIHLVVTTFALGMMAALSFWQTIAATPVSLQLQFNPYAVLSAISLISTLVTIAIILLRIRQRTDIVMWFTGFLLSNAVWAIGELMWRLAATPEAAAFWSPITTLGSIFMPIMLYMFVLSYIKPQSLLRPIVLPLLLGVSALFAYLDIHSGLITTYDPALATLTPWGYIFPAGPLFLPLSIWTMFFPLVAIVQLFRFQRHTKEPLLRKQTRIFLIALVVPLAGGSVTDALLPMVGITTVPTLSVLLLTFIGIVISYGMTRYQLFSFSPSLVANEILSTMSEAVFGLRPDMRISYVNTGAERLLGLPSSQLIGKPLGHYFAEGTAIQRQLAHAFTAGDTASIDTVNVHTTAKRHITAKLSATKLNKQQPHGYIVVATDITALTDASALVERKVRERTRELHEEQARLRASIQGMPLGFLLVDNEGTIITQNDSLRRLFGLTQPATELSQLDDKLAGNSLTKECHAARTSGRFRTIKEVGLGTKILSIYTSPVRAMEHDEGTVVGAVVLFQDITEAKVLERSKDEFFSIASHELRTPLTAIMGNASIILSYYKEVIDADPSLRSMVIDIHGASARLIEIVRDFLDVSRMEQGKMSFRMQPVSVASIIETVVYEMRPIVNEKHLALTTDTMTLGDLPPVWGDHDRILQIVYNLISNAAKFTDAGTISISCTVDRNHIILRAADTGRGISPNNQRLLFHKFQQANDSLLTRDTSRGTGLGLYISRLMAEKMGCELTLESSAEGKGSTFKLTMPIATDAQVAAAADATAKKMQ